ncbi:ATP-dependent RNA helicase HrpA [Agromyces archimandritae]|uniref:ATP-dependent RNA helicase HrpA n=1 Tax=Agromyces archimandritae TaxID=2781962 RepID=A0A975IMY7_9MICO|nr:ATP-dependent RNA helicase HrpA [Agromyces archimandritae]QTX04042.1 ATP-dependent RNA helicase HrpA [Agromyces archimandritae]
MPSAITYPPELPVSAQRDEIARALEAHQVVVVAGATGSGKTTQLPKICLELGRGSIAHTQPRRIAARTIAERIADELGEEVGGLVGYQVRFTDRVSESTRIKVMTDGILLNEIHRDRLLRRYDTIIIDEAHERSLNIDFLLGYLKRLLPKRPELKLVITSATIDPGSFAEHFADAEGRPAPVIEVSGRTFPVEIRYRPPAGADDGDEDVDAARPAGARGRGGADRGEDDPTDAVLAALDELDREAAGDVLVFCSGEQEIRDAEEAVCGHYAGRSAGYGTTQVLPLYGRLSAADQHRVFEPGREPGIRRRIVLATNVAETSLTVPGIRYVVDGGTARISRYSTRAKVQRLPIEPISQASANQRSGRSGRTSAGIAIRLYAEDDFERRPEFTDPEILRTNLASVILQMASLGLGPVADFPFLTPPDPRGVRDGLELLAELGALEEGPAADAGPRLTRIGRQLARLPIEPRFGRMVVESRVHGVTEEVLAIVAGLTVQDPRERPLDKREQADAMHARFVDPTSDFVTLLNLWNHLEEQQRQLGSSAFRRMCRTEFLNYLRVREWQDLVRQLRRAAKPLGLGAGGERGADAAGRAAGATGADAARRAAGATGADAAGRAAGAAADGIHRSLLAGLLSHIGLRDDRAAASTAKNPKTPKGPRARPEFLGARGTRFAIFPGSALAKKPPQAVMSAELVETSRLFARMNAAIDPAWAEALAGPLAKRSFSNPRWDEKQGSAVADEKVLLFGLPIVPKRRMRLARADPELARELFIRHALVQEEWDWSKLDRRVFAFIADNRRTRRELGEIEERTRRRDILAGDEAIVRFYEARVPGQATDARSFERWWREEYRTRPELLTVTRAELLGEEAGAPDADAFPERWRQGDQEYRLAYRFEPGADDDGVTVVVPLVLLPRLDPAGFDWQVPGLRDELIQAMLRTLPKVIRRQVVPAAEWAAKIAEELPAGPEGGAERGPFAAVVAAIVKRLTYAPVTAEDFDASRIPGHLTMTFRAVDARGKTLGSDTDLGALQARLAERTREAVARAVGGPDGGRAPGGGRGRGPGGRRGGAASPGDVAAATPTGGLPERSGITAWEWNELPEHVDRTQAGNTVRAYPALVDDGDAVSLRMLATAAERDRATRRGILRLLVLATPTPVAYVQEHLSNEEKLTLAASPYPGPRALLDDCLLACIEAELRARHPSGVLRTRAEFEAVRDAVSAGIVDRMFDVVRTVTSVLREARTAEKAISKASSLALMAALADARSDLEGLVHRGFIRDTGLERLPRLPRYLQAITARVADLQENPGRDRQRMNEIDEAREAYEQAGGTIPIDPDADPRLVRVRWMLEELRIGLFAQRLGTAEPVSVQRIRKALAA